MISDDFIFWFWKLPEFSFGVSGGAFGRGSGRFLASAGGAATGVPKNSSMQMWKKSSKIMLSRNCCYSLLIIIDPWYVQILIYLTISWRLISRATFDQFEWFGVAGRSSKFPVAASDFGAVCQSNLAMFLGNNLFIDKMHLKLKKCLEAFMACLSYILLESCQEH